MPSLIETIEQRTAAAMNYKDFRHPLAATNGYRPRSQSYPAAAVVSPRQEVPEVKVVQVPSAVDVAMKSTEADAHAALMKLRELVVGPSQLLNEARLEELMKIFEEREAKWTSERDTMLRHNAALENGLRQENLNQLNAAKAEFITLTEGMAADAQRAVTTVREELSVLRKEAHALVENSNLATDQKLESQQAWTRSLMDGGYNKMLSEMEKWANSFEARIQTGQREAQLVLSRAFMEASETLARGAG